MTKHSKKYRGRVADMKFAGAALSANAPDYNSRVPPLLSYVSQLLQLPPEFSLMHCAALHAVYHAPFNTSAHLEFFQLANFGLPRVRCVRTVFKTSSGWHHWIPQLQQVAMEHLPINRSLSVRGSTLSPLGRDSTSSADSLWKAFQGRFSNSALNPAGCESIVKFTQPDGSIVLPGSAVWVTRQNLQL